MKILMSLVLIKLLHNLKVQKPLQKNYVKSTIFQQQNLVYFIILVTGINFIKKGKFPIVIKADGLAAGKGVYICENEDQSIQAINEIFGGKFGEAKKY